MIGIVIVAALSVGFLAGETCGQHRGVARKHRADMAAFDRLHATQVKGPRS